MLGKLCSTAALVAIAVFGVGLGAVWVWDRAHEARTQAELARQAEDEARVAPVREEDLQADQKREAARTRGVAFLIAQQSPDGAWRSDIYATFKDGPSLTPLVVCALQEAALASAYNPGCSLVDPNAPHSPEAVARRKGSEYLAKMVTSGGTIDAGESGLDYPVYTAALAVRALSHWENADLAPARDAWLKHLLDRQLTEKLGWQPKDKEYGGLGYCQGLPRKPEANAIALPLTESNVSATAFALDALRAAEVKDLEVYARAERFLLRCQNEDGGFFFVDGDPVRNKAGSPDPLTEKPRQFHSYGSATADGARGLFIAEKIQSKGEICRGHPIPAIDAMVWLEDHFQANTHPGEYILAHEPNREAVYYYYAASVSRTFLEGKWVFLNGRDWAADLSAELVKRQRADGSWSNPVELVRENDPLVATSHAVSALANARVAVAPK